jgi:hypothetical protein
MHAEGLLEHRPDPGALFLAIFNTNVPASSYDYRKVGAPLVNLTGQFPSVHVRHPQVYQRQVNALLGHHFQGNRSAQAGHRLVSQTLEEGTENIGD